jgi:hypothetical protein
MVDLIADSETASNRGPQLPGGTLVGRTGIIAIAACLSVLSRFSFSIAVTPTFITAITPAHAAGKVDVEVTNPGNQKVTPSGGFTYI